MVVVVLSATSSLGFHKDFELLVVSVLPCRLLSTLLNPPATSLKGDFHFLRKSISLGQRIAHHNRLSVYNLWTMGVFPRCSKVTERNKLMNTRQILMTMKPKMKNIKSAYHLNQTFGENVSTDGTARSVIRKRKWECAVSFGRKMGCSGWKTNETVCFL